MQPFINDRGTPRFKSNKIVDHMLDKLRSFNYTLNDLACLDFPQDDWEQFYQLIGYSLKGYHELSNVSDQSALEASEAASEQLGRKVSACRDDGCLIHCGVERE